MQIGDAHQLKKEIGEQQGPGFLQQKGAPAPLPPFLPVEEHTRQQKEGGHMEAGDEHIERHIGLDPPFRIGVGQHVPQHHLQDEDPPGVVVGGKTFHEVSLFLRRRRQYFTRTEARCRSPE